MKTTLLALAAAGTMLAGCGPQVDGLASPAAPTVFTLTGNFVLYDDSLSSTCAGDGGYDDIHSGASVVVFDEAATVLATSALGTGTRTSGGCEFPVEVGGVPLGAEFYQVAISHRGNVTVTPEEAQGGLFAAYLG